jgi:asparagine synthase (glutamine-hydrolysing)
MNAIFGYFSFKNIENKNEKEIIDAVSALMSQRSDNIQVLACNNSFHLNARNNDSLLLIDGEKILINFDGRIDNRDELVFFDSSISDAKNILNLYKQKLMSKIKLLAGPFAFCIINLSTKKILAYRDQMGVRPLYYFYNKEKFIYSTEIEYIFADNAINKDVNLKKLKFFILKGNRFNEETFFKQIFRLRRSSNLKIKDKTLKVSEYFNFSNLPKIKFNSNEEYIDRFKEIFFKIIKSQINTDNKKIASMLSGGLDTSSITSTIALLKDKSVEHKTYSIVFNNLREHDIKMVYETNYIKDVRDKYSIDSNIIGLEYYNIQDYLKNLQSDYPEPNYHGNNYMDAEMIKAMKLDGHKIILSGFDGDSVISHGEQYLYLLLKNLKFLKFFKEVYKRDVLRGNKFNFFKVFKKYILRVFLPNFFYKIKGLLKKDLPAIQASNFLKNNQLHSLPVSDMTNQYINSIKDFKNFHINTLNTNLWEHVFEFQDIDYSRNGLEIRYPFMDIRLISFCLCIPESQKLQNGISRFILREAMKEIIPNSIYHRMNKSILSPYYDYSIEERFNEMKSDIIRSKNEHINALVDKEYIRSIEPNSASLNEMIIFQHIYILTKWLDFN